MGLVCLGDVLVVWLISCRLPGLSSEQECCGVHPVCFPLDEQPPHEGIPLEMCYSPMGLLPGMSVLISSLPLHTLCFFCSSLHSLPTAPCPVPLPSPVSLCPSSHSLRTAPCSSSLKGMGLLSSMCTCVQPFWLDSLSRSRRTRTFR